MSILNSQPFQNFLVKLEEAEDHLFFGGKQDQAYLKLLQEAKAAHRVRSKLPGEHSLLSVDVHTEHCCLICNECQKNDNGKCTVISGEKIQETPHSLVCLYNKDHSLS